MGGNIDQKQPRSLPTRCYGQNEVDPKLKPLTDLFFIQKLQYGIFQAEQHLQAEERAIIKRLRKELGQERDDDEEEEEYDDEEHDEDFQSLNDDP